MKISHKGILTTVMNILGMGIALSVFMILMIQVRWDLTYDRNFPGHEKVFRVENNLMDGGLFTTFMSRPMIEAVRTSSPGIEAAGTFTYATGEVFYREGDKGSAITIPVASVDSSMLDVFPFEFVQGSADGFGIGGTAILDEVFAGMIFGKESAVGQILETGEGGKYRILGVFRTTPRNCSIHYGIVTGLGDRQLENFSEWSFASFLKLRDPKESKEVESEMIDALAKLYGHEGGSSSEEDLKTLRSSFRITNLHDAYFERDVRANVVGGNKAITMTLAAIAFLLILIAAINFINFAFARIPFRIKGINTRKVLGASRGSLTWVQLGEAALLSLVAFALSVLILHVASGTEISSFVSDSLKVGDNAGLLALTLGIALVTAVIAGVAPALYSTSQPAALVLKGSYALSVKGRTLRNVLIAVQFVLSFIFIIFALYVNKQAKYLMGKDMGFQQENVLQVWCGYYAGNHAREVESRLLQYPAIADVTFADSPIVAEQRMGWSRSDDGQTVFMEVTPVTEDFVEFFGLQIVQGRDFQSSDNLSAGGTMIPNETFMEGFPQYRVGSFVNGHSGESKAEIIGVVKDFNFKPLRSAMGPMVLYNWGKDGWRSFCMMYVKMAPGASFKEASDAVKDAVCAFDPTRERNQVAVRHLDEWIDAMYQNEQSLGRLVGIASAIALLIAIIGIIGLVFFETEFLRKEIALRRVNGASVESILLMIARKYLIMTGVSFMIAAPLVYWLISMWGQSFAYRAPVGVWIFLLSLLLVGAITLLVVLLQSRKAASENPVNSLRNE